MNWSRHPTEERVDREALRASVARTLDRSFAVSGDAALAKAAQAAVTRYIDRVDGPWDPLVASLAVLLVSVRSDHRLVDLFVAEAGLASALDALAAASPLVRCWHDSVRDLAIGRAPGGYALSDVDRGVPDQWQRLRELLLTATDDAYRTARDHAKRLRRNASFPLLCAIAYAFPEEPAWAREALAAHDPADPPQCLTLLLPSLDRPELVERIADTTLDFAAPFFDGRVAMVIERFGVASLPFARRLFVKRSGRPVVVEALVRLEALEVAQLLLPVISDGAVKDTISRYLRAHPAIAIRALAKECESKPKARLLSPLLASIVSANRSVAKAIAPSLSPASQKVLAGVGVGDLWAPRSSPVIEQILATPIVEEGSREAWAALRAWMAKKAPAAGAACVTELVLGAGPITIALLGQLARAVAKHDGIACATAILEALEEASTTTSIREVARLTVDLVDPLLAEQAEQALGRLQERLSLDDEDVRDRSVPDFGIRGASIVLDFGPRSFRVILDGAWKPSLVDEQGRPLKSLPRPSTKDDPARAAQATEIWSRLKGEMQSEARAQARRFEDAMVTGRSFRVETLREVVLAHPVLGGIAQRLLWCAPGWALRIAEDGSFADVEDRTLTVEKGDSLRVVHPLDLVEEDEERWRRLFAEYEIIQPFEQLGRARFRAADPSAEGIAELLEPFAGRELTRAARFVLEASGWSESFAYTSLHCTRTIRGHEATLDLDLPAPDALPSSLSACTFAVPQRGTLDAVALSEVLRDLGRIVVRD